jgi:hypothetical protein
VVLNSISLMDSLVCAIRFPAKSLSSSVLHDRYGASKNFRMGPLSDKGTFNKGWMVFGLVMLVISAICAVVMLTWLTKLMGVGESYDFSDLSKNGWPFSAQGLLGLHWVHWASLITLAAGVFFFILAKLVHGAPAETPEDTIEAKRIQLLDDQGKPTLIVSVSREEQKTSGPL